jgi:ABC-type multidrug transport system permease subunit
MVNFAALLELTKWRLREFMREPEAIFWVFAFPIILALALGIAFQDRGVARVTVVVQEGPGSEELVGALGESSRLAARAAPRAEAEQALRTGETPLVVVPGTPVIFQFDSTRTESMLARVLAENALQQAAGRQDVAEIRERHQSEPGARYIDFLIPGLLGMNIMGTGIWGVGFGIVQTRNRNLLKRFVASPMPKSHYLLGQILARMVFLVFEVGAVLLFGYFAFGVPFRGSVFTVALLVAIGALTFAGVGLLVASRVRTLEGVSGLMNVVMLPMWIFSGVFFSAANFPDVIQPAIHVLPLTALIDALRSVLLEGASLASATPELGVMSVWMVVSFGVALKIFRWV